MSKQKIKYAQPKPFRPTREEELLVMESIALLLSENKVIISHNYPDMEIRGKIKAN
jgi:hypothetical protein